jgi:hypothetical protein
MMLGGKGRYGLFLAQHFLGHSPRTVATRSYVAPPQRLFDEALMWLRERYRLWTLTSRHLQHGRRAIVPCQRPLGIVR